MRSNPIRMRSRVESVPWWWGRASRERVALRANRASSHRKEAGT